MGVTSEARIDPSELEQLLRAIDPGVLLVKPRILRRVIKRDRKLPGLGLQVPHRKSYVIGGQRFLRMVDPAELKSGVQADLPQTLLLLARPTPQRLAAAPRSVVLLKCWRLLFHASIHRALEERFPPGPSADVAIRGRVQRIGRARFEEIRTVVGQENYLFPNADDRAVYIEFAAVYLELRHFARGLLRCYFPSVTSFEELDRILAEDLPVDELYQRCRPEGAPQPVDLSAEAAQRALARSDTPDDAPAGFDSACIPPQSAALRRKLLARAERASQLGNTVRAAIVRKQAAQALAPGREYQAHTGVHSELIRLSQRLQRALQLTDGETKQWRRVLAAVLERASQGLWPVEARLLYDLQKACLDVEGDIYALDLVGWITSLGKLPIRRRLPDQGLVLQVKHLRSADHRLRAARIPDVHRQTLASLLEKAIHRSEERLRQALRPRICAVFDAVALQPRNVPERVARTKMTEELVDRVVERGHINMGDLRDAVSQNNLKLPDVTGPAQVLLGDELIRANRGLAVALDGIYHRGEIYLRWLQRLSALAFGTPVGRFLMLFLVLPFAGAYAVYVGIEHPLHFILKHTGGPEIYLLPPLRREILDATTAAQRAHALEQTALRVGILGIFLLLLINSAVFRKQVVLFLRLVGASIRWLFVTLPAHVRQLPLVCRIVESWPFRLFVNWILRPLVPATLTYLALASEHTSAWVTLFDSVLVFLIMFLLLNSRLGRNVEEVVTDGLVRAWRTLHVDLLPGLFHFVMGFFKWALDAVSRGLYTVDEWLRFREGDGRLALLAKPLLGLVWFLVTYLVRFVVNVLVEPQFNPIKHFPVVTVSHKLVLAFVVPPFAAFLHHWRDIPLDRAVAIAAAIGTMIPGLFGFLAWELKENWRLYRANQPKTLQPVRIGHHGETLRRLLRVGFHSGTLPKLHAKLRRAVRRADWRGSRKYSEELQHVREAIVHFVERELVHFLDESRGWGKLRIAVGAVQLGCNTIRVGLRCPALSPAEVVLAFELQADWLVAVVAQRGWLPALSVKQLAVFRTAVIGLYKCGGVDLTCEELTTWCGRRSLCWTLEARGFLVWQGNGEPACAVYDLKEGPELRPQGWQGAEDLPDVSTRELLFRERPVTWDAWVAAWQADQAGEEGEGLLKDMHLLPVLQPAPV
jgi:hypothetical protein